MEKIYVIGDVHTVSAFRLSGAAGIVADMQDAASRLEEIILKRDAAVVAITNNLAGGMEERIRAVNLSLNAPVVVAIPGIDDEQCFKKSVVSYISEALGISL
jgi:vacuolar-type H+-ATPase subunit F/Vma7